MTEKIIPYRASEGWSLEVRGAESRDIVFTGENVGTYNITQLKRYAHLLSVQTVPLDRAAIAQLLRKIDLDPVKLAMLRNVETFEPVLAIQHPNGGHGFIVDGHHRLQIAWERHVDHIAMRVFPFEAAEKFKVRYFAVRGLERHELDSMQVLAPIMGTFYDESGSPRIH